ncbi:MAG: tetratricopeptide repeat protein [Planctomycetota bacterium]
MSARVLLRGRLAALFLLGALLASPHAARADEALFDPALDRGNAVGAGRRLLAAIEADPADARVVALLSQLEPLVAQVPGAREDLLRRIPPLLAHSGWNRDAFLALLTDQLAEAGRRDEALATQRLRGFLSDFLVCGPFGLAPNAALESAFGAEGAANARVVDARAGFKGWRDAPRPWRELRRDERQTSVGLGDALEGAGQVSYALTHVKWPVDEAADVFLVYRGPSAKVWWNRALATTIDRSSQRLPGRIRVPLELRPGWNRLLLKVTGGARTRFAVQLVTATGEPLVLEESRVEPVEPSAAESVQPLPRAALVELADDPEPARQALRAWYLSRDGLREEALDALEAVADAAPAAALARAAWYHLLHAELLGGASHLPQEERRERVRQAFHAALQADPESVSARRMLAEFELEDDKTVEGVVALEDLLAQHPNDLQTRLRLFDALRGEGWLQAAEEVLAATPERQRGVVPVLRARYQLLDARGEDDAAEQVREQLYERDRTQSWVLIQRVRAAARDGDARAALAGLEAWAKATGATAEERAAQERAVYRSLGRRADELRALRAWCEAGAEHQERRLALAAELAEDAPTDPAAKQEAVRLLEAHLAEEPGAHAARQLLEGVSGSEDRFWEEWEPRIEDLLKNSPDRARWPRANRVCLLDQTVTKIYPDTATVDVVHQVWRMLDESANQSMGERPRLGETLEVRTISPAGEVKEPIRTPTGSFQMPGLVPGSLVEHAFRQRRNPAGFQYSNGPFYFMDPDQQEPFWISRWVLLVHKDAPVQIIERNMRREGITHKTEQRGDWVLHVYEARNQPRMQPEPMAPDRDELLPWIKVIEARTLDDLDGSYREDALIGRAPAPSVVRKAKELVAGLGDDGAKARKLSDFVHEHVRDPGGGGRPEQVLAARRGSKTALLLGLLEAADVPYQVVLAGKSPWAADPTDWYHPEPGQFGVPLVRIEPRSGKPFYLVPFAHRFAPRERLPFFLWDAPAYVCDPAGGVVEVLPNGDLEDEKVRTRIRLKLGEDGGAEGDVQQEIGSYGAFAAKERLAAAQDFQLRQLFSQQASQLFPGGRLVDYGLPGLEEPGVPLRWQLRFQAQGAVSKRGDGALVLRVPLTPSSLTRRMGTHRTRVFDLVIAEPAVTRDVIELDLGPFSCPALPESVHLNGRLLQFTLRTLRPSPGKLRIERRLTLRPGRVTPTDYAEFRDLLRRVDEAEQVQLTLEK